MAMTLSQICTLLQAAHPDPTSALPTMEIHGVSTLVLADPGDLCLAETVEQADAVRASRAGAVVVPEDFPLVSGPFLIRSPEPRNAFFRIAEAFVPVSEIQGIHPQAVIDPSATFGPDVAIGPCAVIAADVRIEERCIVGPGCYIGPGVALGAGTVLEANVTLHRATAIGQRCLIHSGTVIGGDGFGFRWDGKGHHKIPQLGRVVIENDVEIGCNTCVDRATLGETRIRSGTKIDNLVQIAHNTDIGEHVILVSQSGVAGSSSIGTGTVIAGQVAVSDHVKVGPGARIGGQSGVTKDIPAGATVFGTPARPIKQTLRELAALAQLPALRKQLQQQEQEMAELRQRLEALEERR